MLFRTQKRMYCVVQKQRRGGIVLFQEQRKGGSVWFRDAGEKVLSFQKQRTDGSLFSKTLDPNFEKSGFGLGCMTWLWLGCMTWHEV